MAKRINEVEKVTTMNNNAYVLLNTADGDTVQIKKTDLANALADVMRTATSEKAGLMSAVDKSMLIRQRSASNGNLLVYATGASTGYSVSLFVSATTGTQTAQRLYFVSISKVPEADPVVRFRRLGGDRNSPELKYTYNEATGEVQLFLKRFHETAGIIAAAALLLACTAPQEKILMQRNNDSLDTALSPSEV